MDEILELAAVNVVEFVRRGDLDISHQEGRVEFRVHEAPRHVAARYSDLVQNIAIGRHDWMVGLAAEHIDGPTSFITVGSLIGKKWPCSWVRDTSPGFILVKGPVQRPAKQVALGPI